MPRHPAVHRFAHWLIVGVWRFDNRMLDSPLRKQMGNRFGPGERFACFPHRKLKRILCRARHHQTPLCGQTENVPFFCEAECSWYDFTHAAGCTQVRLIGSDRAGRDNTLESFVKGPGVHGLVPATTGTGDPNPIGIDFRSRSQIIDRSLIFVDLQSGKGEPDGEQRGRSQFTVVLAQRLAHTPFPRTEGIDAEYKKTEFCRANTA